MISRLHRMLPALLAVDALLLALGVGSFLLARHGGLLTSSPAGTPPSLASRTRPATATSLPSPTRVPATATATSTPIPATATSTSTPIPATPTATATRIPAGHAHVAAAKPQRHHEGTGTVRTGQTLTGARLRHFPHAPPSVTDWSGYDTAIFVASTLNLPRCAGGSALSTMLVQHGARGYTVLRSVHHPSLYFIRVRMTSPALLSVYAYQLGWKFPEGVLAGQCVPSAPYRIGRAYQDAAVVLAGRFTSLAPA